MRPEGACRYLDLAGFIYSFGRWSGEVVSRVGVREEAPRPRVDTGLMWKLLLLWVDRTRHGWVGGWINEVGCVLNSLRVGAMNNGVSCECFWEKKDSRGVQRTHGFGDNLLGIRLGSSLK